MTAPDLLISIQSDQVDQIAAALAEAQTEMENASTNSKNPRFNSRYADLASVRNACVGLLSSHGIAVTQPFRPANGEAVQPFMANTGRGGEVPVRVIGYVQTQFTHSSGQWMRSELPICCNWGDIQALGGTISYLRRYMLAAMAGLAQEDDDGNTAKGDPAPAAANRNGTNGKNAVAPSATRHPSPEPEPAPAAPPPAKAPTPKPAPPAPAPAPVVTNDDPQTSGRSRPKDGPELWAYALANRIDPHLAGWINGRFHNYDAAIQNWTKEQVAAAWPDIRTHLERVKAKHQLEAMALAGAK